MSERCDTCVHWRTGIYDWTADEIGFGRCGGVKARWVVQDGVRWDDYAGSDDYDKARVTALSSVRAYVQDGSEYRAELITGPDFFCALHQPAQLSAALRRDDT